MPTSEAPTELNRPKDPAEPTPATSGPEQEPAAETIVPGSVLGLDTVTDSDIRAFESSPAAKSSSRWVDYDTHELLRMISDLEDERRWARLREGFWLAILFHIILFSAITWIPTYLFKAPKVIDPFDAIKQRKDLTYLDLPPEALRQVQPRVIPKPLPPDRPLIDKRTMEEMQRQAPPAPAPSAEKQIPAPVEQKPQPTQSIPPSPQSQQPEAPRPQAVPARPNFALGPANPADQLRQDMQKAMQNRGSGSSGVQAPSGGLSMHPGAGTGQPDILSDTQGVDFSGWMARWHYITQRTWDPLIPDEVNPPILKSGVVAVRFKVLPNGQVVDMQLDGRSGDTGLDRAAWGAITGSSYPPLPREFHGPYLELRAYFLYNMEPR